MRHINAQVARAICIVIFVVMSVAGVLGFQAAAGISATNEVSNAAALNMPR